MKRCESCGFENPQEGKFCKKCGTKLPEIKLAKFCRSCGKEAAEGTLFCTGCGKSLQLTTNSPIVLSKQAEEKKPIQIQKPVQVQASVQPQASVQTQTPVQPQASAQTQTPVQAQEHKKKNLLPILIVVFVLAAALIAGAVWFINSDLFGNDDSEKESTKKETQIQNEDETEYVEKETEIQEDETQENAIPEDTQVSEIIQNVDRYSPIPLDAVVTASSSYDNNLYAVSSLSDGNAATSWAEGVAGYGVGEYLNVSLNGENVIYGMAILPGNLNTIDEFNSCSYPVKFEITAGDKTQTVEITEFNCDFNFANNPYVYLDFAEPVKASEVRIAIAGVYENINSDVTYIAELRLYTYPVVGETNNFSVDAWKVAYAKAADYILPTSNSTYLTMEDLQGLTADECRIARNELYARYGRKFLDEGLQAYFDSKSWYTGIIEPEDFNDLDWLNEYEIANRDLIVEYETLQGYR